jgi:thiamine-monophosphate kinase
MASRRKSRSKSATARRAPPSTEKSLTEWGAIDALARVLGTAGHDARSELATSPRLGIGDDAALLEVRAVAELVWTIDATVEGVHFERAWLSLDELGWKATHAAVSDLAAMGARPVGALSHLVLPRGIQRREVEALGAGQAEAARALRCPILGGNISSGEVLEIATTVLGELPAGRSSRGGGSRGARSAPLLRSGARVGDELWLLGNVGLAAAGLDVLRGGLPVRGAAARCVQAWRKPEALITEGLGLRGRATACLDVSDGLAGDARHLAEASGVAVHVDQEKLRATLEPTLLRASKQLGRDALDYALFGGEDYALLATGPARQRPQSAKAIGQIAAGRGVWLIAEGESRPLEGGFEHLAAPDVRSSKAHKTKRAARRDVPPARGRSRTRR